MPAPAAGTRTRRCPTDQRREVPGASAGSSGGHTRRGHATLDSTSSSTVCSGIGMPVHAGERPFDALAGHGRQSAHSQPSVAGDLELQRQFGQRQRARRRSWARGCGRVSSGVARLMPSIVSRSRSSVRGARCDRGARGRGRARSACRRCSSSSGASVDSSATALVTGPPESIGALRQIDRHQQGPVSGNVASPRTYGRPARCAASPSWPQTGHVRMPGHRPLLAQRLPRRPAGLRQRACPCAQLRRLGRLPTAIISAASPAGLTLMRRPADFRTSASRSSSHPPGDSPPPVSQFGVDLAGVGAQARKS